MCSFPQGAVTPEERLRKGCVIAGLTEARAQRGESRAQGISLYSGIQGAFLDRSGPKLRTEVRT